MLATVAVYNSFFGRRFDELFREAAAQIKAFAQKVQQEGGSIMSRVDGDVTVKNLTEVEASKVLSQEYGRAQETLRKVSKFKKAVDSRRSSRWRGRRRHFANRGHHWPRSPVRDDQWCGS